MHNILAYCPSLKIAGIGSFPWFLPLLFYHRLNIRIYIFIASLAAWLLLNTNNLAALTEIVAILIGPIALFFVLFGADFKKAETFSSWAMMILVFEAASGYLLKDGLRSITFITNEPSHAARWFFSIYLINTYSRPDSKYFRVGIGSVFTVLNGSVTALLFFLVCLMNSMLQSKKKILVNTLSGILILFACVAFLISISSQKITEIRFISHLNAVVEMFSSKERIMYSASTLTYIGGRRLTQSIAGFEQSQIIKFGGLGGVAEEFVGSTLGATIDLNEVSNISERPVVPNSYVSNLMYILGVAPVFAIFFCIFNLIRSSGFFLSSTILFIFSCLQLILFSTMSSITPWIFLAYSFEKRKLH